MFAPHLLPPVDLGERPFGRLVGHLEELPSSVDLLPDDDAVCRALVEQLGADTALRGDVTVVDDLLLFEFATLLLRLRRAAEAPRAVRPTKPMLLSRRFTGLVEQHYRERRSVQWYADELACTAKTLQRASERIKGLSVSQLVDARLVLEAKRLLSYAEAPIKTVATDLGFGDVSNFSKFFVRYVGKTASQFRAETGDTGNNRALA